VVEDAEKIEVRLKDGRSFQAEIRGVDAPSDVAIIKIPALGLPAAKLGDSNKTRVGEFAIAIGAPFALDYSVTFGHVSAKDRSNILPPSPDMTDQNFIQTDANINPGNSGGPLVNIDGEVIGVNTLIRGLHTGIGFAIPINLAREVSDKLISEGKFTRPWLGVNIVSLRDLPEFRDLVPGVRDGVVVHTIVPNAPVGGALKPADVILSVDGRPVVTSQQLKDEIRRKAVGQKVVLEIFRPGPPASGGLMKVTVRPAAWQAEAAPGLADSPAEETTDSGKLAIQVKPLTSDLAVKYHLTMTEAIIVTYVDKAGLAARSGIKSGDLITSVNQQSVTTPKQWREAVKSADFKRGFLLTVVSDGSSRFEIIKDGGE
jgi:serine protease Do